MDDSDFIRRNMKMKVKFRPTGICLGLPRGRTKSTTLEAYCPMCKTTIEEYGQERCSICEVGLDWDFAIAWD